MNLYTWQLCKSMPTFVDDKGGKRRLDADQRRNLLSRTKRDRTRRNVATVRRNQEILKLAANVFWLGLGFTVNILP